MSETKKTTVHIASIGVGTYQNGLTPLPQAIDSARQIFSAFTRGYRNNEITSAYHVNRISSDISSDLSRVFKGTEHGDTVIVYYAGHGSKDGRISGKDSSVDLVNDSIDVKSLLKALLDCNASHLLFFIDACYSGSNMEFPSKEITSKDKNEATKDPKQILVLGSSWHNQVSNAPDEEGAITFFARSILDALTQKNDDDETDINVIQFISKLHQKTGDEADSYGVKQHPSCLLSNNHDFKIPKLKGSPFLFSSTQQLRIGNLGSINDKEKENQYSIAPYKFLDSFTESDADLYPNRPKTEAEIINALETHNTVVLQGISGSGKSSVIHAGVLPQLGKNVNYKNYYFASCKDYSNLFGSFKRVLESSFKKNNTPNSQQQEPFSLSGILTAYEENGGPFIFIFDQFEAFLALPKLERDQIAGELEKIIDSDTKHKFIFILRKEMLGEFEGVIKNTPKSIAMPSHLSEQEAIDAIKKPFSDENKKYFGEKYKLQTQDNNGKAYDFVQETLVKELFSKKDGDQDVTDAHVQPPHLQIVCHELIKAASLQEQAEPITIGKHLYNKTGKAEGILKSYLNNVVDETALSIRNDKDTPYKQTIKSVLYEMVSTNEYKKNVSFLDICSSLPKEEEKLLSQILDKLIENRIVVVLSTDDVFRYTIAHDVMISEILKWFSPERTKKKRALEILASCIDYGNSMDLNHYEEYGPYLEDEFDTMPGAQQVRDLTEEEKLQRERVANFIYIAIRTGILLSVAITIVSLFAVIQYKKGKDSADLAALKEKEARDHAEEAERQSGRARREAIRRARQEQEAARQERSLREEISTAYQKLIAASALSELQDENYELALLLALESCKNRLDHSIDIKTLETNGEECLSALYDCMVKIPERIETSYTYAYEDHNYLGLLPESYQLFFQKNPWKIEVFSLEDNTVNESLVSYPTVEKIISFQGQLLGLSFDEGSLVLWELSTGSDVHNIPLDISTEEISIADVFVSEGQLKIVILDDHRRRLILNAYVVSITADDSVNLQKVNFDTPSQFYRLEYSSNSNNSYSLFSLVTRDGSSYFICNNQETRVFSIQKELVSITDIHPELSNATGVVLLSDAFLVSKGTQVLKIPYDSNITHDTDLEQYEFFSSNNEIEKLCANPQEPNTFFSLSRNGEIYVWNIEQSEEPYAYDSNDFFVDAWFEENTPGSIIIRIFNPHSSETKQYVKWSYNHIDNKTTFRMTDPMPGQMEPWLSIGDYFVYSEPYRERDQLRKRIVNYPLSYVESTDSMLETIDTTTEKLIFCDFDRRGEIIAINILDTLFYSTETGEIKDSSNNNRFISTRSISSSGRFMSCFEAEEGAEEDLKLVIYDLLRNQNSSYNIGDDFPLVVGISEDETTLYLYSFNNNSFYTANTLFSSNQEEIRLVENLNKEDRSQDEVILPSSNGDYGYINQNQFIIKNVDSAIEEPIDIPSGYSNVGPAIFTPDGANIIFLHSAHPHTELRTRNLSSRLAGQVSIINLASSKVWDIEGNFHSQFPIFSSNHRFFTLTDTEGYIHILDIENKKTLLKMYLGETNGFIYPVHINDESNIITIIDRNFRIIRRPFYATTQELIESAQRRVRRELTYEERREFNLIIREEEEEAGSNSESH